MLPTWGATPVGAAEKAATAESGPAAIRVFFCVNRADRERVGA